MMGANILLWSTVGWVLTSRLYASSGFLLQGYAVRVDLYDLDPLKPFARVAILDVLIVMGAMAIMPLQSLDAQFRWSNYEAGLFVTLPSALVFFTMPLWGVHRAIQGRKLSRLQELQKAISACDPADIPVLETLVAHRDRIHALRTWPVDLRLLIRTLFYLVIPPLAWVGAALVEKLLERVVS
jgi:hypothetical protein